MKKTMVPTTKPDFIDRCYYSKTGLAVWRWNEYGVSYCTCREAKSLECADAYREMRVRPIREGTEGVTISGTEYVMDQSEMMRLRDMLNEGIMRLNGEEITTAYRRMSDPVEKMERDRRDSHWYRWNTDDV